MKYLRLLTSNSDIRPQSVTNLKRLVPDTHCVSVNGNNLLYSVSTEMDRVINGRQSTLEIQQH